MSSGSAPRRQSPQACAPSPSRLGSVRAAYRARSVAVITGLAAVLGLLAVIDAIVPEQRDHLHDFTRVLPMPATAAAAALTAVSGIVLLRLAAGLRKRKRRAWRLAVGASAVMALGFALRGRHLGAELIAVVLLVLLFSARARFTARSDPATRWFAVRVLTQSLAISVVYGLAVLYLSGRVRGNPSVWLRLQEVLYALIGARGPIQLRGERFGTVFHATLLGLGLLTLLAVALLALRPAEPISRLSPADEQRLRDLLARHGERDSLGYFATRRDKSVIWSPSGKAAISYRVVHGVALASGDPIGDPEAWPAAISAYAQLIAECAWTPAVIGCSELGATVFKREMALSALTLGDEAIIEVADFALQGRAMRTVRQACTRVARGGYEVSVRRAHQIGAEEGQRLRTAAASWRGAGAERGFSMALSRVADPADGDCVIAAAYRGGVLCGLLHFVPWGTAGLSLDLMRRDRGADNGLNEYLIAELLRACPALGIERVSLNFAVFRDAIDRGAKIGAGPFLRLWRRVLLLASRWWQIESLYRFNAKFQPRWQPRLVSFPAARDLPRIVLAALEAEAFLVRPHAVKRLLRRQ